MTHDKRQTSVGSLAFQNSPPELWSPSCFCTWTFFKWVKKMCSFFFILEKSMEWLGFFFSSVKSQMLYYIFIF
uniref:Uncharacterized protein n=1 Tax=Anguilla anguilla TaxID=7936 RepID=A0A0E9WT00_ANGAN